jgi:hypothetical protein
MPWHVKLCPLARMHRCGCSTLRWIARIESFHKVRQLSVCVVLLNEWLTGGMW